MELLQPARLQVDPETITDDDKPVQTGHTFNVWYLKWAGGDSSGRDLPLLKFRLDVERDSGYTKASDGRSPLCLFFARGCCYKGKMCHYSHRTPRASDVVIPTQDCFGRDKTTDYNDDMSGVGLLQKSNRTLYVSGVHMNEQVHENLSKLFLEFGSIDKIKILHSKGCAFISFRLESEAQFAKEAMNQQTVDGKDVLSVKWANDDPNPTAQQLTKRHMEETAMETVRKLLKGADGKIELKPKTNREEALVADTEVNPDATEELSATVEPTTDSETGILGGARLKALGKIQINPRLQAAMRVAETHLPQTAFLGYSSDEE